MQSLPTDIIDRILDYLDNKSYLNSLFSATLFHTYRFNNNNCIRYLQRKYPNRHKRGINYWISVIEQCDLDNEVEGCLYAVALEAKNHLLRKN